MAFALGSTLLSSSYQVANNLPNQLYELVCGGMIVTAFLPVYVSVKKKLGQRAGNEYASNLLTLVVLLLGAVSLLCMLFPSAVIYTQSFYSDQSQMATSVFFFQFFAIQIVFYGCSAIVSGLLNASRDYLWSSIAPVANNLIVIVTFLAYSFVAPYDQQLALYIIAIGNPAGVFIQMAIQLPALKRNGIRIRPRVNLRDPALRWESEFLRCLSCCAPSPSCRCKTPLLITSPTMVLPSWHTRACGSRCRIRSWPCPSPLLCSPSFPICRQKATRKA